MGSVLDHPRPPFRKSTRDVDHQPLCSGGAFPIIALLTPAAYPSLVQLVRNIGITHGDETRVAYYVGLMVRAKLLLAVLTTSRQYTLFRLHEHRR